MAKRQDGFPPLDRRRRTRRLRTSLTRSGVWVTTFLTRRKLYFYPPTTEKEHALMQDLPAPRNWPAWVLAWVAAMVLWMPVMRGLAWVTIWVAYLAGQTPDPPPADTAWTP